MINYIRENEAFRRAMTKMPRPLTAQTQLLYHHLFSLNNRQKVKVGENHYLWKVWFAADMDELIRVIGFKDSRSLRRARNRLIDAGWIAYLPQGACPLLALPEVFRPPDSGLGDGPPQVHGMAAPCYAILPHDSAVCAGWTTPIGDGEQVLTWSSGGSPTEDTWAPPRPPGGCETQNLPINNIKIHKDNKDIRKTGEDRCILGTLSLPAGRPPPTLPYVPVTELTADEKVWFETRYPDVARRTAIVEDYLDAINHFRENHAVMPDKKRKEPHEP